MSHPICSLCNMSNNAASRSRQLAPIDRQSRRALANELPVSLRRIYKQTLLATLREGLPVDPDALVILLSVLDESAEDPLRFCPEFVEQLLWCEITSFCAEHEVHAPEGCGAALFAVLALGMADESFGVRVEDPEKVFGVLDQLCLS